MMSKKQKEIPFLVKEGDFVRDNLEFSNKIGVFGTKSEIFSILLHRVVVLSPRLKKVALIIPYSNL